MDGIQQAVFTGFGWYVSNNLRNIWCGTLSDDALYVIDKQTGPDGELKPVQARRVVCLTSAFIP